MGGTCFSDKAQKAIDERRTFVVAVALVFVVHTIAGQLEGSTKQDPVPLASFLEFTSRKYLVVVPPPKCSPRKFTKRLCSFDFVRFSANSVVRI